MRTWMALSLVVAGCASDAEPECIPSQAQWENTVQALVTDRCGNCHGVEPDFGAPFSLIDYQTLIAGPEGARIVDEMGLQVAEGTMPPTGFPQPPVVDRDTIAGWASCGTLRVTEPVGATRPPFQSPPEPPPGLTTVDINAGGEAVGADVLDRYVDFDFTNLVEEDVFIRRFEAVVDESRVLHHLTLRRGDPAEGEVNMKYLYAWAPGTGDFEFPNGGGVRLRPGDNLRLQIHYNNGAGIENVRDSSGIRLHVGPIEGDEYVMVDPGPGATGFSIPARSEETVERTCEVQESVTMIASMPHMHEIGQTFAIDLTRGGDTQTELALESWDFETQLFYELPLDLEPGDQMTVRCGFQNPSDSMVSAGPRTSDEMCFAFSYVTPPNAEFCRAVGGGMPELVYAPGVCVGEGALEVDPVVGTSIGRDESPAFDADGVIPDGRFAGTTMWVVSDNPSLLRIATISFAGQLLMNAGDLNFDGAIHFLAPTADLRDGQQEDLSVAGTLIEEAGPSELSLDCPTAGVTAPFVFGTVDGQPAVRIDIEESGFEIAVWVLFEA
ncbi:MAG: hypothetical protein AAGE52_27765 [Myxococcota bacterium]